jgi:hypothetical protein
LTGFTTAALDSLPHLLAPLPKEICIQLN